MITRIFMVLMVGAAVFAASAYQSEIARWQSERITKLTAPDGWLSLAGLFWLHEGDNPFGKDPNGGIVLPDGPAHAGVFHYRQGKVTVTIDGKTREVLPDTNDILKVGRVSLQAIKRSEKMGIRVKDPQSPARVGFKSIESYPADESYRVTAKWVADPKKIPILNILGQTDQDDCPGYAVFKLKGREYQLHPIIEEPGDQQLFYIFKDETSGKETYPAGRFFYSDMPKNGQVVMDFNKAYNPPCAFTPYATCPLPPPENRLAVRIEAGEKRYSH